MDATLRALISACKEDHDDTPRLVLADWLEEHGEEARGQLLRVQCELARGDDDPVRRAQLVQQEQELLREYSQAWLGPLAELPGEWSFQRGFLAYRFDAEEFLSHAEGDRELNSEASWIEQIQPVNVSQAHLQALMPLRLFAGVSGINLSQCNLKSSHLETLSQSHHPNLVSLNLQKNALDVASVRVLAKSDSFSSLKRLDLALNHLGRLNTRTLFSSQHLTQLTHLSLGQNYLAAVGVMDLASSSLCTTLSYLDLEGNGVGDTGLATLAESICFARLVRLSLKTNGITEAGAQALANTVHLKGLTHLNLTTNVLGDAGVQCLAASSFPKLTHLFLASNQITQEGVQVLAGSPLLVPVRSLDLGFNEISDLGAQLLAQSPSFASLRSLHLRNNRITGPGARALAESPHLENLALLQMRQNPCTPRTKELLRERFGDRVVF